MYSTVVAWVSDGCQWQTEFNRLDESVAPDFTLMKVPADDWIVFTVEGDKDQARSQFVEAADLIGMDYRIDEVN